MILRIDRQVKGDSGPESNEAPALAPSEVHHEICLDGLIEFYEDNRVELYNLKQDAGEQHDLAAIEPGRALELRQRLHAWRGAMGAAMPTPNPDYRPPATTK